jgi:alpha-tubulin suppressor-like RCC1 family protein
MKRTAWLLAAALTACVDSGCPKGSEEVDGTCMEKSSPLTGDSAGSGGSGTGGSGNPPERDAGAEDASSFDDAAQQPGSDAAPGAECDGSSCEAPCAPGDSTEQCACEPGFERTGATCTDIDECATGSATCDPNATCLNEPGTFTCECAVGYEGDGTTCTANPCEPRANPCDTASTVCRAEAPAVVCDCVEGFGRCDGDPHACTTDLRADREHCGTCETSCAGDLACSEGACEQAVTQLALGVTHSCALAADGEILCWGNNDQGQLARAPGPGSLFEPIATRLGKAHMVAAGNGSTCAMLMGNNLTCWGHNLFTWFAPNTAETAAVVSLHAGLENIRQIAVGSLHACLVARERVECWGIGSGFVLGEEAQRLSFADRNIVDIPGSVQVGVGSTSCALGSDAQVRCWGGTSAAIQVIADGTGAALSAVRQISVSIGGTSCAVLEDGRALCWGVNSTGQLGNPAITVGTSPRAVVVGDATGAPLSEVEQIAVGFYHACARLSNGSVMCWGQRDRLGGGGTGSAAQRFATPVRDIDDAIDVACGGNHSCVRRRSGQVQCWGENVEGQLGTGTSYMIATEPVEVVGLP